MASKRKFGGSQPTAGRKTVLTDGVIAQLEEAFKTGLTAKSACAYAEIDQSTYFRRMQSDPDFARKMTKAQEFGRLAAGSVVMNAIVQDKDIATARWYLEKKYGDEFGGAKVVLNEDNRRQEVNLYVSDESLATRIARIFGGHIEAGSLATIAGVDQPAEE
jgi:hypothetical protein